MCAPPEAGNLPPLAHGLAHGEGAADAADGTDTLLLEVGEGTHVALDAADAGAVLDLADALDNAVASANDGGSAGDGDGLGGTGQRRQALGGNGNALSGRGLGGGLATGDGGGVAAAVLLDGHGLEHGVGALSGGVDGEDHALAAVRALGAVEP